MIHLRSVPRRQDFQLLKNRERVRKEFEDLKRSKSRKQAANENDIDRRELPYWVD